MGQFRLTGRVRQGCVLVLVALLGLCGPATADERVAAFYAGKTITIITSTGSGGLYDLTARLLGRHMPRYLPGSPSFVVRNMPGGGHTLATNFLYTQAPRDGTTLATVVNTIPLQQAITSSGVRFDANKLIWIGTAGISNILIAVWHGTGVKTFEDAKRIEVVMGATGAGAGNHFYPLALNTLLGTRFKIVTGYKSANEIDLALTRGEVQGNGGSSLSSWQTHHPDWLAKKLLVPIAQVGAERELALPGVPLLQELTQDPETRAILELISTPTSVGRPYLAPPDVPAERVAALRAAFMATMADAEFRAEAQKQAMELRPMSGEKLEQVVKDTLGASPARIARVKALMSADTAPSAPAARK